MTVEKLERVLWRLRKLCPEKEHIPYKLLRRAIMIEIGTDIRTYKSNVKALRALGWIKTTKYKPTTLTLTNEDL